MVDLKGYKVNSISIENKVPNKTQLKLQNKFNYNVNYNETENKCLGLLTFKIDDANGNNFEIKIDLVAEFSFDKTDDKPTIHTESFDAIFPYVRAMVTNLTAMAGMQGLVIPTMKLKKENVSLKNPAEPPVEPSEGSPLN